MSANSITKWVGQRDQSPEEAELQRKRSELEQLEAELAQRELDLLVLQDKCEGFRKIYVRQLGPLLSELAEHEAEIQEAVFRLRPDDASFQESARQAREKADAVRQAVEEEPAPEPRQKPKGDRIKTLYRQAAKLMHPDLSDSDADRDSRTRIMAEVNAAFADGDEARIEGLIQDWTARPEAVQGQGTAAELVKVIRRIAQIRKRLDSIEAEIDTVEGSEWNDLRSQYESCTEEGQDFFKMMRMGIQKRIDRARARLQQISQTTGH